MAYPEQPMPIHHFFFPFYLPAVRIFLAFLLDNHFPPSASREMPIDLSRSTTTEKLLVIKIQD